MREPDVTLVSNRQMGVWRVIAKPRSVDGTVREKDVTWFRDFPTRIDSIGWTDPFGPSEASLTFPGLSPMEQLGVSGSDAWWVQRDMDVDIEFAVTDSEVKEALEALGRPTTLVWEGYVESLEYASGGSERTVTMVLAGAMRILDRRVAQQITLSRPHAYEWIIARLFADADDLHPTRLAPLRIEWPEGWGQNWGPKEFTSLPGVPAYLQPVVLGGAGVPWSGMVAREMGRWDPILSSTIQGLLSVMFTEKGQFTLHLDPGRIPVMRHRYRLISDDDTTMVVDAAWPGVQFQMSEDGSQTANTIYGSVRSTLSGTSYTGLRYYGDGSVSNYAPFASLHPVADKTPSKDDAIIRRELYINFADGLWPAEAMQKARQHIGINASPGHVGQVTLNSVDPLVRHPDGEMVPYPASMIRAGDSLRLAGAFGNPDGELFTITQVATDVERNTTTLTVDSKFRDFMTVREVQERGRDALRPWHLMTVGKYIPNIPDALLPWNYNEGSGYIPLASKELWERQAWIPGSVTGSDAWEFPWLEITKAHPPKHNKKNYIRVPAIEVEKDGKTVKTPPWNRSTPKDDAGNAVVLLSQAGEIALLQIAAFDEDGNVKKVPFHVSFWSTDYASAQDTPKSSEDVATNPPWINRESGIIYPDGSPYPFFKDAWEQYDTDGSQTNRPQQVSSQSGLIVGYGNHWGRAGYWPGTSRWEGDPTSEVDYIGLAQAPPTGLLIDDGGWSYDLTQTNPFDLSNPANNTLREHANATCLIFCESDTDTYFMGRLWRKEYGTS